ncbi:MAG: hypothetical protein ACOX44_16875 [Limnochordia bacterium]
MHSILKKLAGGDRRSIGRANEVAEEIVADSDLFAIVLEGILHDDPIIRMRAADAIEKASSKRPELLQLHKHKLLGEIAAIRQQEVRWHLSLLLPRLYLDATELQQVLEILDEHLGDTSTIVRVNAMQALADLALQYDELRPSVIQRLKHLTETGSPATAARGRKLLKALIR